jgi:hypothetical protein
MTTIEKTLDLKSTGKNLRVIATVDIAKIKELINNLTEDDWLENTSRQTFFNNHSRTVTYFMVDYDLGWTSDAGYQPKILRPDSELWKAILPIVNLLEEYHDGRVGRVIIPKLLSGGTISAHRDSGEYLESVRRHHLPITTNENVFFAVDGEVVNMREGEIWEIHNNLIHEVENLSHEDRVHILIDIIPNKYLN